jgi:hypothetical protein
MMTLNELKALVTRVGYRFDTSPDGTEERLIRPDGTVAVIARKKAPEDPPTLAEKKRNER